MRQKGCGANEQRCSPYGSHALGPGDITLDEHAQVSSAVRLMDHMRLGLETHVWLMVPVNNLLFPQGGAGIRAHGVDLFVCASKSFS